MKKKMILCLCTVVVATSLFSGCGKKEEVANNEVKKPEVTEQKEEVKDIDYVLYFRHKEMPFLFDEAYTVKENDPRLKGKSIEEFIIQELINVKPFAEYLNPMPEGAKLLSIEKENRVVKVNLSKEFQAGLKGTKEDTTLTLAAVVNAITILPENDKVIILIEGKPVSNINKVDTSKAFEYFDGLYADK
ncbi:GerMN domain-containing protein [Lutibacter sp. B2]|nr:GerMN domain-containing protein [Lutibacter sp. B2]